MYATETYGMLQAAFGASCMNRAVLSAPTTTGTTITLMFDSIFSCHVRSKYLFIFSLSFIFTLYPTRTVKSTSWQVFLFLSLRVFGLLSSSLWLFPQHFGRYVLRPSSGVCRTRELSRNFELRPLLNPRGSPVLIPLAITGYKC